MNFHGRTFLAAVGLVLLAVACDKDDDKAVPATRENLAGTYRVVRINITGSNANLVDSLEACERDNLITLNLNSTVNVVDAGVVCDPPADETGNWEIRADSIFFSTESGKIKSFNGKELVIESEVDFFGTPIVTTSTFSKQ